MPDPAKRDLSERDICSKYITPALTAGGKWDLMSQIREEVSFTKGRVIVRGKLSTRGEPKRADYVLSYKPGLQLAVVEVLVAKTFRAAKASGMKVVSMSGGVSANACLREMAAARAEKIGVALRFAPDGLRTDNALMIAYAAAHHLAAGHHHPASEDITPNFDPAALCI